MRSDSINELMAALAKAQGEMSGAAKDCNNPHFKSRYADLASVWDACRQPLSKNGLAVSQTLIVESGVQYLETILGHSSGQWVASRVPVVVANDGRTNNAIQQLGSIITYLRRYTLAAIVGVAPDDDDGNSAESYQHRVPDKITQQQVKQISQMIDQCPQEVKTNFWAFLQGKDVGIQKLEDLSQNQYQQVKAWIERRIQK